MARIRAGDQRGLEALLTVYGGTITGILTRRFGPNRAEEAVCGAAYVAWSRIERFDESRGSLPAWFLRVAENVAFTLIRGDTRWQQHHSQLDPDSCVPTDGYSNGSMPNGSMLNDIVTRGDDALLADLRAAIAELPPLQRAVAEAELGADPPSAREIADMYGTTANSVYVSRHKAHATIRLELRRRGWFTDDGRSAS